MTLDDIMLYGMSLKSGAIGEIGYLAKYGKNVEGKIFANHVFPVSSVEIFLPRRAVTALHSLHYK
jgi:hypothetical protein